jgi:hypothetical protein
MALVIFEGPDGGGKSTLINYIMEHMVVDNCIVSEGPERFPGEINERIRRYHSVVERYQQSPSRSPMLFDRHPCISQPIYGLIHDQASPTALLVEQLYTFKPFIIYCRPMGEPNHTQSDAAWDTPEFLANVDLNFDKLVGDYDAWSLRYANLTYRIGDPMDRIVNIIRLLQEETQ